MNGRAQLCLLASGFVVLSGCSNSDGTPAVKSGIAGNTSMAGSAGSVSAGAPGNGGAAGVANGGAGNAQTGGSAGASGTPAKNPIDESRVTLWNPGILSDEQLMLDLGDDGLPVRTTICATPAPGDDLNAAIAACPEGQVVSLQAGTYTVSSTVTLTKGVVLRGAGSGGAAEGGTTIVKTGGGSVLSIGTDNDSTCYSGSMGTPVPLTADASKETTTVTVGDGTQEFSPGDLAFIDQLDDDRIDIGDSQGFFKRADGRSLGQRVEIAAVDADSGTLTLSSPLHWTFQAGSGYDAMITKALNAVTRYAGIENLRVQGGTNPDYLGLMAGGIEISNAAYCWVKDVQTDETIGGMHVAVTGSYRTVVRDSYFHNSADYGFAKDCYGIVLRCGSADNLVENNIARYMNKPILFNASGGGNVIGYNYADNSFATPSEWQEVNIDIHCAFPHMELMEGNYAPHMGATITHGNAGNLTYFRNYSSSQFAPPAVIGFDGMQDGNIVALQFDAGDIDMNVVGNVLGSSAETDLGTAPLSASFIAPDSSVAAILEVGDNLSHTGVGMADVAYTSLFWHGNYDSVNADVVWSPDVTDHALPNSLYLPSKPKWWPADTPFPWAGPDLTPMVGSLPAKVRADKAP